MRGDEYPLAASIRVLAPGVGVYTLLLLGLLVAQWEIMPVRISYGLLIDYELPWVGVPTYLAIVAFSLPWRFFLGRAGGVLGFLAILFFGLRSVVEVYPVVFLMVVSCQLVCAIIFLLCHVTLGRPERYRVGGHDQIG